jgi:ribosomal protein S3
VVSGAEITANLPINSGATTGTAGGIAMARDMLLDEGEVHLRAGNVAVQQATNHAWVNRGNTTCRIAFILIDGKEP